MAGITGRVGDPPLRPQAGLRCCWPAAEEAKTLDDVKHMIRQHEGRAAGSGELAKVLGWRH
jgi:hypothetical protein